MSKNDSKKYEPTLIYTSLIKAIAAVRKHGAEKYGSTEDWRTTPPTNHFNAIFRHLNAHLDGEYWDKDSELPHLHLAASTLMFEIERMQSAKDSPVDPTLDIKVECPRCKSKDMYGLLGVYMCSNGCGYVIDPLLFVGEIEKE